MKYCKLFCCEAEAEAEDGPSISRRLFVSYEDDCDEESYLDFERDVPGCWERVSAFFCCLMSCFCKTNQRREEGMSLKGPRAFSGYGTDGFGFGDYSALSADMSGSEDDSDIFH